MSLDPYQTPSKPRRPAPRPKPSQPWTTARCHRLLRPLISRIASLRRDAAAIATVSATATSISTPSSSSSSSSSSISNVAKSSGLNREGADTPEADSKWLMPKKKRVRLTYSQRRAPRQQQDDQPGEREDGDERPAVVQKAEVRRKTVRCLRHDGQSSTAFRGEIMAPTPLLRRARGHIVPSPLPVARSSGEEERCEDKRREPRTKRSTSTRKALDGRLAKIRVNSPAERYNELEAIYKSLEALLKATALDTAQTRGPRSFLDMCLRKVPQYITELDAWERWEAEQSGTITTLDDVDTSAQIYNELESIGTNQGWKHLRVVVRADGVEAAREGIAERLFSDDFSQLLIDLCIQSGAVAEAEELMAALVDRPFPLPASPESSFAQFTSLQPLTALSSFATKSGRASYTLRQYSVLLSSKHLPQDWLATPDFERIWGSAARALSSREAICDVINFMVESISLMCSRKRTFTGTAETIQLEKDMLEANQRTLTSALTIVSAMSLLGENATQTSRIRDADVCKVSLLVDRLKYILKACIAELEPQGQRYVGARLDLLYLALFLSSGKTQGETVARYVKRSIENATRQRDAPRAARGSPTPNQYDSIVSLIASVARSCSRGTSVASHQCLDVLFERLNVMDIGHQVLDSLKAASAFLLAQQTNNVRDLIYAESLYPHARSKPGDTHDRRSLFTGYRWEETIGEWVTVSPIMKRRQSRKRQLQASTGDEDDDKHAEQSPARPTSLASLMSLGTNNVPDLKTIHGHDVRTKKPHQMEAEHASRKRTRHSLGETLTPISASAVNTLLGQASVVAVLKERPSSILHDELAGQGKENRDRMFARKPRRSSGKLVLGTRSRSSLSSLPDKGQADIYSDDELCL
ncbi:Uu.00g080810.m01.CDS01 [Anthostomella pinea]|uniref:Uu.00g080810.m01.CDS01 n=1 Tax=Anthostomella pinea TaxID=933095 RepID=A0AAI8VM75_9PEZI|nr:Uu.00g080810.m01.CDS01 [Anthostomella pinea]